jgi:hypothetical protein
LIKIFSRIFQFVGATLATSGMMFFAAFGATLIANGIVDLNFLLAVLGVVSLYVINYCLRLLIYFVKKLEDI